MHVNEERIIDTFFELVKIDSESKDEAAIQAFLKEKLVSLGLEVFEDDAKKTTGYGANNLLGRLAGSKHAEPIFFCCHMDTVPPGIGIKPEIRDGNIYSDGTTILAADDKAGIAALLELIVLLKEEEIEHGTIEFVFTVGEETGLVGAEAFDMNLLQANEGFVLDTGGPVGAITVGSPTLYMMDIMVEGVAAHAGIEPEKGVSALEIASKAIANMRLGRIDEETTANLGTVEGGTATNVVMDHVHITAEARSISAEAAEQQVAHMKALFQETAEEMGGEVNIKVEKMCTGYRFTEDMAIIKQAQEAIRQIERTPIFEVSGGGSDANVFNEKGKQTVNLSVGYEKIHTVEEYIPVEELKKAAELAYHLVHVYANK